MTRRSLIPLVLLLLGRAACTARAQALGSGYASSYAVGGVTIGGVTSFGAPILLKSGVAPYLQSGADPARWGDYSATVRDPSAPGSFWTIQEYAAGQSVWGTRATELTIGAAGQVTVGANFTATTLNEGIVQPPDTTGAVGPSHVAELLNSSFDVFTKGATPALVLTENLNTFWVNAGNTGTSAPFDPRLVYDKASGRWFASSLDNAFHANRFLLAVSNDSDPTHGFKMVAVASDPTGQYWADFDTLGVNSGGVYLSGNMFKLTDTGNVKTTTIVIPKADLLGATPSAANARLFALSDPTQTGYSLQPVVDVGDTPSGSPEQFLSDGIVTSASSTQLLLSTITGTGAAAAFNPSAGSVSLASAFTSPSPAVQPGSTGWRLDAGDARLSGGAVRVGSDIWAVNAIDVNGRAGLQWYQIDAGNYALKQSGRIVDSNLSFFEGSISADNSGNVVIGFTGSGPGPFAANTPEPGACIMLLGITASGSVIFRRRKSRAAEAPRLPRA